MSERDNEEAQVSQRPGFQCPSSPRRGSIQAQLPMLPHPPNPYTGRVGCGQVQQLPECAPALRPVSRVQRHGCDPLHRQRLVSKIELRRGHASDQWIQGPAFSVQRYGCNPRHQRLMSEIGDFFCRVPRAHSSVSVGLHGMG